MARWATYVKSDELGDISSLIVDTGNFSVSGSGESDQLKAEYLAKIMSKIGCAAVSIGEREISQGSRFLSNLKRGYALPLISANVYYQDIGRRFTRPYVVRRVGGSEIMGIGYGGVRVGIVGLADDKSQMLSAKMKAAVKKFENPPEEGWALEVRDPKVELEKVIQDLRNKCDLIVVLTEMDKAKLADLVVEVQGVDVIIGGKAKEPDGEPSRLGRALFVQPGSQGKYGGDLTLDLGNGGEIVSFEGKAVRMDSEVPNDEEIEKLTKELDEAERELRNRPPRSPRKVYAGAKSCRKCHSGQYDQWESTPHAHALSTLKEEDRTSNCLPCHTTGYQKDNGFWNEKSTPHMADVQCEACHGGGYEHVQKYKEAKGDEQEGAGAPDFRPINSYYCRTCHNKKQDPDFNYEEALTKVAH